MEAAKKQFYWNSGARTVGMAAITTAFSALVGYRHADGIPEDDLMPKVGPMPAEAVVGIVGLGLQLTGWLGQGMLGSAVAGATDGCGAVFLVSGGQSLGHKIHEWTKGVGGLLPGTGGPKRERAQLEEKAHVRDAHGRPMEVRVRKEQPNQEL